MRLVWTSRFAVATALLAAACLAGCGSTSGAAGTFHPATPDTLTVATAEIPVPGFWEGTPARPTGGFAYAYAHALADRLGLKQVRIRVVPFARLVSGDLAGADLALSLLTPTAAREEHLAFSTPYLDAAPTALVRSGDTIPDLYTAQQLRWGAVRDTTFVGRIEQQIHPDAPVRQFADDTRLNAALLAGRVDAIMYDLPLAVATAQASAGRLDVATKLPGDEAIAAALPLDSGNVQAVDAAIRSLDANDTTNDLLEKWVGSDAADTDLIPLLHTTL